ncbi:MAG: hypothetical protein IKT71_06925 [Paludibacteraceae bacterium]|nr:hypothetical protein [Paludibacteraceae bacterium]
MNNSLFNYVKRLAIAVVFLSYAAAAAADGLVTSYYAKCSVAVATGSGSVYVSKSKTNNPSYGSGNSQNGSSTEVLGGVLGGEPIAFYLYSNPSDGYYLKGWTQSSTGADVLSNSNINPHKISLSPTSTDEAKPKPDVTYYAVFKQYVYGYGNGRTAEVSEGQEYGEISLDNSSWSNTISESASGTPIPKKQAGDGAENKDEDYITLTYYARFKEGYNGTNCYFDGWYDAPTGGTQLSKDFTYNYQFKPTSHDSNNPSKAPKIYARFGKKAVYKDHATTKIAVRDANGKYIEIPEENQEYLAYVGGVYVNSNAEITPDESDYLVSATFGSGNVAAIASNAAAGNYYYTYRAQAKEGFKFVGWTTSLPNNGEEFDELKEGNPYTHTHFTNVVDDANAQAPTTLYAVFSQNTFYFYRGAIAGFTENGEKGKITVTSQYYNTATEGEQIQSYAASTKDAPIDDSESIYNTALNVLEYKYTYKAEDTDLDGQDKTTFKGWSRSPYGGDIVSPNIEYTETYTTTATTAENAAYTPALYAVFQSFWFKDPTVMLTTSSAGAGQVAYIYATDQPTDADWKGLWKDEYIATDELNQVPANDEKYSYSVWYRAQPEFGTYFAGWANANDPKQLITDDKQNPYKISYTVTNTDDTNPYVPARVYAVFKSVIEVIQQDRMIYHVDENGNENINDANVIINFNKADKLTATLKDNADIFQISDKQKVSIGTTLELDATTGIMQLVVSYKGNTPAQHAGKTATITLSAEYTDENGESGTTSIDVKITIEREPFVTFLPTDGKGAYIIKHTDGRGIGYTMPNSATENINVSIAQENMATFELSLTEDVEHDGLTFAGWQMIVDNVPSYFSYDKKCTYSFKESVFVRPVFLADNRAVFTIIGDEYEKKYFDLQLAIDDAQKRYQDLGVLQVVVFSNDGKVEGTLQQGNYNIPNGVMLLIPGVGPEPINVLQRKKKPTDSDVIITDPFLMSDETDLFEGKNKYVYREKHTESISADETADVVLFKGDYTNVADATQLSYNAPYATCYRKLIVESNTSINVANGGIIQLYAVINREDQDYDARPYRYGHIEMGENCNINLASGSCLHAFGFITGAHSSRVVAESGAEVHELFQYSDPRGGTGVAHLYLKREYYKVFPFSQYYVQNVEIPMELKAGAIEYITTSADVLVEFVVMTPFVIPASETNLTGLFHLGTNTSLIKYYDPLTDRQKYIVKGAGTDTEVSLGNIIINMGDVTTELTGVAAALGNMMSELKHVSLNSDDYVLPLNNNMDIFIESTTMNIAGKFAFLAGSTVTVDETAKISLLQSAKIYIYDADENLLPAAMRTNPATGAVVNNYASHSGYFSASNNALETVVSTPNVSHLLADKSTSKRQAKDVKDSKWIVNGTIQVSDGAGLYTTEGGAQITSTKNGKIMFAANIGNSTTYQAKYFSGSDKAKLIRDEGIHYRASYPVTSAKLQNANGSYETTSQNTFTYDLAQGRWITSGAPYKLQGSEELITLPDYDLTTEEIDPHRVTVTSSVPGITTATISWDGGVTTTTISGISSNEEGTHIPVTYKPVNKAGEYEALLSINGGAYTNKIKFTENYTPRFATLGRWLTTAYLGYTAEILAGIVPEENNVAGIITGTYAPTWVVDITGEHADEFTLVWGEGENKLTNAKIVFKPKTSGNKSAVLSLTCSYADAANVVHTTTKTIPLVAAVQSLQANTLAFADGVESIFISKDAQPLFKNINSSAAITIEPATNDVVTIENVDGQFKITPKALGSVTITATQEADLANGFAAATISKTITVTDDIVWNWERLYFGSTNTNPVSTKYSEWSLDLVEDTYKVILNPTLVEDGIDGWVAKVAPWEEGETTVKFTMTYWEGEEEKTKEFVSEVYRDPRHLSISVNDERIYEAITIATSATVEYAMGYVALNSAEKQPAQWTFQFIGIPDELSFTATGLNNWQIEESPNGTNWTIAYTWAKIAAGAPFELSLQPSTRYVRISYGTEHAENVGGQLLRAGTLSNIAVSELKTVKADVTKLYMPAVGEGESTSKNVVFTYASEEGFDLTTTNNVFSTDPSQLSGLDKEPFYVIKRVAVNSRATSEILGALNVKGTETSIPIQVFGVPQAIPIQLASDHAERYYYVASQSYRTTWDETERAVVMHNAVADASPYVVFHYADAPTPGIVSFNYSAVADGARWVIEKSTDGTSWNELNTEGMVMDDAAKSLVMRRFPANDDSRYLRITLVSDYAENVSLTNVAILPTANVVVNPASLTIFDDKNEKIAITANNLQDVTFTISEGFQLVDKDGNGLTEGNLNALFLGDGAHSQDIYVKFLGTRDEKPLTVADGTLTITTTKDAQGVQQNPPLVLATVELLGVKRSLAAGKTGIYTGVKTTAGEGETSFTINGFTDADGANYREVDVTHAFANGTPLFDYVIIYGATTTDDESTTITTPTSTSGSNAKTPCYIYKKVDGTYKLVDLTYVVENANASTKSWKGAISISDTEVGVADSYPEHLKVYITGFAPYASTGYSKADNAAWHFKGDAGDKIDIYLEDCYIYSRYKTKRGNSFSRNNGETFSDKVARGSGAVLMFENNTQADGVTTTMDVTIHTRGTNLLKSHYGCLFESIVGRAFQVSAPVQIYMQSESHVRNSYTVLNFTDEWPTAPTVDANGDFTTTERTNGFVSLRKQVNNAPSIDMGNTNTVVNFRGGQVELQNACNSSDNYESTLAISARSGIMGPAKFRFRLAYGIGTDEVGGRVNFYDGTTTVLTMTVPERYRQYYLMDGENEELSTTSCLRTPKKTFIYGGSHCMMRACTEPTSKGGAPTDGDYHVVDEVVGGTNVSKEVITGNPLGLYQYTNSEDEGWTDNGTYGLVTPTNFPTGLEKEDKTTLASVHAGYTGGKYGVESITPTNGVLNFWIPGGFKRGSKEVGKQPEVEQMISYWKACMTYIEAKYGVYEGNIGGPTSIAFDGAGNQTEQVQNLLYCEIDKNIYNVISSSDYAAPVLNPAPVENAADKYMSIAPTKIGVSDDPYAAPELKNNITNEDPYVVQNKAYYIAPAQADIWMAFTAPFNVKNIYIMETRAEDDLMVDAKAVEEDYKNNPSKYPEYTLENPFTWREAMLKAQARHNADFASFFGVAMALDSKKPFNEIYQDYIGWAKLQDGGTTERSKYLLTHFDGVNWNTAQYYLYENGGVEEYDEEQLKVNWQTIPSDREVLMTKGNTYSLFFPYCMGCWEDGERDFWDYWTGKFLIFESTDGNADGHSIDGTQSQNWQESFESGSEIHMFGNTSLSDVQLAKSESMFPYDSETADLEAFIPMEGDVMLKPTQSFLYANITVPVGQKVTRINRDGKINYGPTNSGDGNTTGTHMPTVGGGNDLFITAINGGINVAVAAPQHVRVLSATGATIYSGMVQTAVDVNLPTDGIYIVSGEREVQKILY